MKKNIKNLFIITIFVMSISNEKIQAQMFWNNACSFAGISSSYVAVPNSTSLNITGSFTLEAWILPTDITNPAVPIIVGKGTSASYDLRLSSTGFAGRVAVRTNGGTKLFSKTAVTSGNWTHVAATYNSSTGVFSIYINGTLDTNSTVAGAAPTTNSDSLLVGKGANNPFAGQMDEVRVWNRALSSTEVNQYRRTSLGTSSGIYSGLVMSMTFQDNDANGAAFTLTDQSGNSNNGINRGVTAVDLSNRPYQTININDCIELNGTNEYLAAPDATSLSPSDELTLEAWIFPRSIDKNNVIIQKGTPDGITSDYNLSLLEGRLHATINNINKFSSDNSIPLNQWSHVAFTFDGPNGFNTFYLNGKVIDVGINDKGFIIDGTDSLYIGGTISLSDFDGYIDEVRITEGVKSAEVINEFLFKSIDESNDGPFIEAAYNLDGYTVSNVGVANRLFFRNGANFSHSGTINNQPVSPLDRADSRNFQNGFYLKSSNKRIPASGTSGLMVDDTLNILLNETITDVNVFVALNHTDEDELRISLVAPNGDAVILFESILLTTPADNIITIFDDQADSSIVDGRYVSLAPVIKSQNNMNATFSGDNTSGRWRLVINDNSGIDTGRLYGWGIQFNNRSSKPTLMSSTVLIQGFYNSTTNLMIRDTMRFIMRYTASPYEIRDSAKAYLQTDGSAVLTFNNITNGFLYYIQLKHRNSIETWNANGITFDALTSQAEYNFTSASSKAFGDNMIQVDASPVRFAIYGGDVDQNGNVDASDLSAIDNDAFNFVVGYVQTDITGDDLVDASDAALADNNAANFVSAVLPPVLGVNKNYSPTKNISKDKTESKENLNEITEYSLKQNFPNPFNPVTLINYELPIENFVSIKVFDVSGKEVMTLVDEKQNAGRHSVNFNGSNLSSGTYYYKLVAGAYKEVKQMILVK